MGDRTTDSPSRIPVLSDSHHINGTTQKPESPDSNGQKREAQTHGESKGFETFVMTGEMIIRTSQKTCNPSSRNPSDSTDESFDSQSSLPGTMKSNHMSAESGFGDHDAHEKTLVTEDIGNTMSSSQSSTLSSDISSDVSVQTVMKRNIGSESASVTDSSSGVVSPENSNGDLTLEGSMKDSVESGKLVTSKSADKIASTSHQAVRGSKSQELRTNSEFSTVNIDIEEDVAHSLDQIPQQGLNLYEISKSAESSPEQSTSDRNHEREFIPGFISLDDSVNGAKTCDTNSDQEICAKPGDSSIQSNAGSHRSERDSLDPSMDPNLLDYQPPVKSVDQPSANRLAKRLFLMDGFKKSDVARHLSKKNEFSSLVAEEYLKYFNFYGDTLDKALRRFLSHFSLIGETQERERVLDHFSRRFIECNAGSFNSVDACHTLTCAIMLLNTDLHGQGIRKKMTCSEFIENLAELNDGENFDKEVLKSIYHAIKTEQIEWAVDEDGGEDDTSQGEEKLSPSDQPTIVLHNPYLDIPDPNQATEYKSGYIMRKCCKEPDSKRTPLGKRAWKVYYSSLKDMVLYLYKDQHSKGQVVEGTQNAIRIHHGLASKASDYVKKQHVFRLETADWAEYLIQTSDSNELQAWIDTINFVAASFSAPALPSAVGSQKKFQRPLLPASYTKLNLREQLESHDNKAHEMERDLHEHRQYPPEKGSKARVIQDYIERENYLEHELKRYKTYVYLLKAHMAAYPELEPSLVETVIGEVDESGDIDKRGSPSHGGGVQRSLSESEPS
ncbi:PH and SEC7 domain-containing protein-like isoform X3 [Ostrea edulis]|uniref:PH and SEC7 domain-containing protein-like isoform X3 n=1 Tax=Ostrea edulis TaxID=37623 RepID=UPI0024AE9BA2|nr:PH and SEC7 domain-containing protein-like isoform X3 [Ostrea edulis]